MDPSLLAVAGTELNKGASPQRSLILENRDVLGIWTTTMMISEAACHLNPAR
jgi:hypothetical protein